MRCVQMYYTLTPQENYQLDVPRFCGSLSKFKPLSKILLPTYNTQLAPLVLFAVVADDEKIPLLSHLTHSWAGIAMGEDSLIGNIMDNENRRIQSLVLVRQKYFTLNAVAHELSHAAEFIYMSYKNHPRTIKPRTKSEITASYTGYLVDNAVQAYKHHFASLLKLPEHNTYYDGFL